MPIRESEAIVLRRYPLAESDRIIVFFSREFGKLRAVGHSVRKPKSRLGGCLEPLNHVRLEYYTKEGAGLAQVRQCEIIHAYLGKNPSLRRVYAFTYFAELLNNCHRRSLSFPWCGAMERLLCSSSESPAE